MKKVYIIHGYKASSNDHWFPWLSRKIKEAGHDAKRIMLDQPLEPQNKKWQDSLHMQLAELDQNTIIVAHDLACLAALEYIQTHYEHNLVPICAGIFVAGFKDPIIAWSELNKFVRNSANLNVKKLPMMIKHSLVFLSTNDPYVPAIHSLKLGNLLHAQLFEVMNAGHFTKKDGFENFDQLWTALQPFLDK